MSDSMMNISERCRLCIEPKRLSIDIFSEEGRRIKLKSKINKNLPLKVSQSDGLPSQICYQCLFRLETWVSFKQLCLERDQVMKTWSQTYMGEISYDVEETFNDRRNNCKSSKTQECNSNQTSRSHPDIKEPEATNDALASSHLDDAKSDSSVWEVVKMDDTDNMEAETQQLDVVRNENSGDYGTLTENSGEEKLDWDRRKSRKPSKARSSGSDVSMFNDADSSCPETAVRSPGGAKTSSSSYTCFEASIVAKELSPAGANPPPMKRKRGRPSKAFLQKEKELKKIREHAKVRTDNEVLPAHDHASNQVMNYEFEKEDGLDEDLSEVHEVVRNLHPHVAPPEFTPVERDDGSGVTEVVLDDPDFGSMKFTLSVVEIDSPVSSPIPSDSYNYYNYSSSTGNLSSNSLLREDFEGFESPTSSSLLKALLKDEVVSSPEEKPRSRSQADLRISGTDDILPAGIKRKRSTSSSDVCTLHYSNSDDVSGEGHGELISDGVNFHSCAVMMQHISKSSDNINISSDQMLDAFEERNAHSDSEISESPNKRFRRKSSVSQGK